MNNSEYVFHIRLGMDIYDPTLSSMQASIGKMAVFRTVIHGACCVLNVLNISSKNSTWHNFNLLKIYN